MIKFLHRVPYTRIAFLGFFEHNFDQVLTPGYEDLEEKKPTGIAGIKRLFTRDKYGITTPELTTAVHMSMLSTLGGMMTGIILHGREAWINFMENNQASKFANHFEANQQMQKAIIIASGRGAAKWGLKIGGFSSLFLFSNIIIAAYFGKSGYIEYVGAGAITGGLFKMNLGLKGMVAGTVIGTILGAITGAVSISLLYISHISMGNLQNFQYEYKSWRDKESVRVKAGIAIVSGDNYIDPSHTISNPDQDKLDLDNLGK